MGSRHARPGGPIRICFPFVGDRLGGSHISALKLVQALDRHSFEPRVVLHEDGGRLAEFLRGEGIGYEVLALPSLPSARTLSAAGAALHLARVVPRIRAFLPHTGSTSSIRTMPRPTRLGTGRAARGRPAGLAPSRRPGRAGRQSSRACDRRPMITVSNFARPNRPALSMDRRVRRDPQPVRAPSVVPDRASEAAMLRAELGVPADTRILGYFGNLVERKRPLLFVDVVDRVRRAMPDIPVVGCLFGISLPGRADLVTRRPAAGGTSSASVTMCASWLFASRWSPTWPRPTSCWYPRSASPSGAGLIRPCFLGTPVVADRARREPRGDRGRADGLPGRPDDPDAFVPPVVALLRDGTLFDRVTGRARASAPRLLLESATWPRSRPSIVPCVFAHVPRPPRALPAKPCPRSGCPHAGGKYRLPDHRRGQERDHWLQKALQSRSVGLHAGPELHYFSRNHHLGDRWYFDQFPVSPATRLVGEKSNSYLDTPWRRRGCMPWCPRQADRPTAQPRGAGLFGLLHALSARRGRRRHRRPSRRPSRQFQPLPERWALSRADPRLSRLLPKDLCAGALLRGHAVGAPEQLRKARAFLGLETEANWPLPSKVKDRTAPMIPRAFAGCCAPEPDPATGPDRPLVRSMRKVVARRWSFPRCQPACAKVSSTSTPGCRRPRSLVGRGPCRNG